MKKIRQNQMEGLSVKFTDHHCETNAFIFNVF